MKNAVVLLWFIIMNPWDKDSWWGWGQADEPAARNRGTGAVNRIQSISVGESQGQAPPRRWSRHLSEQSAPYIHLEIRG